MPHKDRKVAAVGLVRMLTQSTIMLSPPSAQSWCVAPPLPTPHARSLTTSPSQAASIHGRHQALQRAAVPLQVQRRGGEHGADRDRLRGADGGVPGSVLAARGGGGRARGPRGVRARSAGLFGASAGESGPAGEGAPGGGRCGCCAAVCAGARCVGVCGSVAPTGTGFWLSSVPSLVDIIPIRLLLSVSVGSGGEPSLAGSMDALKHAVNTYVSCVEN